MKQYLNLLKHINDNGDYKSPVRDNMPTTKSVFGYQMRFNMQDGFPILTTKKVSFKNIVIELLWFLRGDTNIKYLVDNGCNIWNKDAYNYYLKIMKRDNAPEDVKMSFKEFVEDIQLLKKDNLYISEDYTLGDCGYQYGKVWRDWENLNTKETPRENSDIRDVKFLDNIDQISNLIKSLKETPESRRHIITSIDPANSDNLALFWCHVMAQFNCRLLSNKERVLLYNKITKNGFVGIINEDILKDCDINNIPKYKLDCHLYQRSADVFLGVPYNISSYALLTHIIAEICNMQVGEFVHTFGDVHIYDNHIEQVDLQLQREPMKLPKLVLSELAKGAFKSDKEFSSDLITALFDNLSFNDFKLENYNSHPSIKAPLSTGLK